VETVPGEARVRRGSGDGGFMRELGKALVAMVALWLCFAGVASAQQVEVLWLGHSTFRITSTAGKVIVIDPFLTQNPRTPAKYKDLKALGRVDLILITHGHQDHILDLRELAALTGAPVVGPYELVLSAVAVGAVDGGKAMPMNKGGMLTPFGAGVKIHLVPADHSSGADLVALKPDVKDVRFLEGGNPVGYVIEFENGFKVYHCGDTNVFGDMALIQTFFKPDLALVPIGGRFTMGPEHAAYAVRELIRPKQVIPIHYGTFPVINRTPAEFKAALGNVPIKVLDVRPGDALKF
jgi:L-ascorbate metabolism protein UlaG (beta-lactamase superfamily)